MRVSERRSPFLGFAIYTAGPMIPCLALLAAAILEIADHDSWPSGSLAVGEQSSTIPPWASAMGREGPGPIRTGRPLPNPVREDHSLRNALRIQARDANQQAAEYLSQEKFREAIEFGTRAWELSRSAKFALGAAEARKTLSLARQGLAISNRPSATTRN